MLSTIIPNNLATKIVMIEFFLIIFKKWMLLAQLICRKSMGQDVQTCSVIFKHTVINVLIPNIAFLYTEFPILLVGAMITEETLSD